MAKKKLKKKDDKKKESKKKILKLKLRKKKDSKKKDTKKKDTKKKDTKKKDSTKKEPKKKKPKKKEQEQGAKKVDATVIAEKSQPVAKAQSPRAPAIKKVEHSSNYNVRDALKKIRSIKSKEELLLFIKGEKRLTITKVIPAALDRLK